MKKLELTKKGKLVIIILGILLLISIIFLAIYLNNNHKIENLVLDIESYNEQTMMIYEQNLLVMHVDSEAQLKYTTYPKNKKIDVIFNNYDKDIIKIDSLGRITALKTGKTELQIFDKNNLESNIIRVHVY